MPDFIPGLQLSELFYHEIVKGLLEKHFPGLAYSAGLIGYGSEVIGFDTPQSTDHMWGPRLYLFLGEEEDQSLPAKILTMLADELPYTFKGYSVNFSPPDPTDNGVQWLEPVTSGPVNHLIRSYTLSSFFKEYLNCDPSGEIDSATWLTFSEHRLLTVTAGRLFRDDLGLAAIRQKLAYYPHDIWLYLLAAQWAKISQEEAFVGRCGDVGDEIGSQIIAARIVQSLMRLCFLMEKQYAPYSKWFGSGFARLASAKALTPVLRALLGAPGWPAREQQLATAYTLVAEQHNGLGLIPPLSTGTTDYFGRPYQVLFAGRFAEAIQQAIGSEAVKAIEPYLGSVSQFSDSTDVVDNLKVGDRLKILYRPYR
jgi:hypothetical protein